MQSDAEEVWITVPEGRPDTIVITVPTVEERSSDAPSWAERVESNQMSHMDSSAAAVYPSHLRSEIFDFDGVLPTERLGELSHDNRLRLFRLNGVPNRPCTARFSLPDPSIDSSRIMEEVVSTGVERKFVKCIQRFRSGVVEITFARKADCDLFLSKAAIPSPRRPSFFGRPARTSFTFVTVRDAPWELNDKLITDRLEQYGTVLSCRRAFNQSLLPEKIHDGRRVIRMSLRRDIPSFIKFGPFWVRVFYPGQPKVCWKCASPDHIGRECPSQYCFNCDKCGHLAHDCDELIKCSLCKSEDHLAIDCPANWGRRTLAQRNPPRTEEPEPAMDTGEEEIDDESTVAETEDSQDSQELQEPEPFPSEDLTGSSSEEEVSDSIDEFTSSGVDPTPHQRKRSAVKVSTIHKKSRTDENPP